MEQDGSASQLESWRKQQRQQLIARRLAVPPAHRREWDRAIAASLNAGFSALAGMAVAFCWPFKGEFDVRPSIKRLRALGVVTALPVVTARAAPLQFRKWWPGAALIPGEYGIPVPRNGALVIPDAIIMPLNGFDERGYRLGYGGGYFDMTLAAIAPRPLAIGVGYELARLPTVRPQQHDAVMDFVVTEAGIRALDTGALAAIDADDCRERVRVLCQRRIKS